MKIVVFNLSDRRLNTSWKLRFQGGYFFYIDAFVCNFAIFQPPGDREILFIDKDITLFINCHFQYSYLGPGKGPGSSLEHSSTDNIYLIGMAW